MKHWQDVESGFHAWNGQFKKPPSFVVFSTTTRLSFCNSFFLHLLLPEINLKLAPDMEEKAVLLLGWKAKGCWETPEALGAAVSFSSLETSHSGCFHLPSKQSLTLGHLLLQAALSQAQLSTWELRAIGRNTKRVKHTTGEHRTYQEERCDNQTGEQVTSNNIFHGSSRRKMICPRQILQ